MTRILCAAMASLLLLTAGTAALAAEVDFSQMTLEELYKAREALEARIFALEHPDGATCYAEGSYLVGRDLPEGDYTLVEGDNAMFASVVVRAGETEDDALILHKLVTGRAVIRLRKDTWVTLSELNAWPLGTEPDAPRPDGSVGEGGYLVGPQLEPGSYVVAPEERAPLSSYSTYTDILGTVAGLTRFELIHAPVTVALSAGDYIELSGCTLCPEAAAAP